MFLCCYCIYTHTHRWNWRLQWCSFDLLRAQSRQFMSSSQDTLQSWAMLSYCFACVLVAFSLFVDVDCWAKSAGAWSLFTHRTLSCPLSNCGFLMTLLILNLTDQKVACWLDMSVFPCQGHDEHKTWNVWRQGHRCSTVDKLLALYLQIPTRVHPHFTKAIDDGECRALSDSNRYPESTHQ